MVVAHMHFPRLAIGERLRISRRRSERLYLGDRNTPLDFDQTSRSNADPGGDELDTGAHLAMGKLDDRLQCHDASAQRTGSFAAGASDFDSLAFVYIWGVVRLDFAVN